MQQTIFSHIVQKRFSQVNEDVATDALAFVLNSSDSARSGMMRLLRGVAPGLPDLRFLTQQTAGNIRPDMWGYDGDAPRVYVENKFWAGLTDNQPVSYLRQLAGYAQPTILLAVAPEARVEMLWRELTRRLRQAGVEADERSGDTHSVVHSADTAALGPILAITSWSRLLSTLETEAAADPTAQSNLLQLRSLCDAADANAFTPISAEAITDQRIPTLIRELSDVIQAAVQLAETEKVLYLKGTKDQAGWGRIGRYAKFENAKGAGIWIGTQFGLWKTYGRSPLWVQFSSSDFGQGRRVKPLLEAWAEREGVLTVSASDEINVALDVAVGEDKDRVVRQIVDQLQAIADVVR